MRLAGQLTPVIYPAPTVDISASIRRVPKHVAQRRLVRSIPADLAFVRAGADPIRQLHLVIG